MNILRSRVAAVTVGALVVVGLGAGGAVAGDLVTGRDIKNHTVRGPDLGSQTVGVRHLRDRVRVQLSHSRPVRRVVVDSLALYDPGVEAHHAQCPRGLTAVGGGAQVVSGGPQAVAQFTVSGSYPQPDGSVWTVDGTNSAADALSVRVFAVCSR